MNLSLLVSRNEMRFPKGTAIVDAGSGARLTWSELNRRTNRLANAMLASGLRKGDRVAIYARNCAQMAELFFACAKSGIIVQPLNWRHTVAEISSALHECRPRGIVVGSEFAEHYIAARRAHPFIDLQIGLGTAPRFDAEYEDFLLAHSDSEPESMALVNENDPLFLFNTGGTTGVAKSVILTHKNAMAVALNVALIGRINEYDCFLLSGPMFHAAVTTALAYMFYGAKTVIMSFEPQRLLQTIVRERVSSIMVISTMMNLLLELLESHPIDRSGLRSIIYAGSAISANTLRRAMATFRGVDFIQALAQTEAGVIALLTPEDHRRALKNENLRLLESCGREAPLTEVRIIDTAGNDVPRDGQTTGEIIVRGPGVMRGYWNRPDLTAATIPNGWCHTGDLATWDEDGYLHVVDRKKDMIISGGENIYSAVVEQAVNRHPDVKECAVIGVPHNLYGETVKAIVVPHAGRPLSAQALIDSCRRHLASYMKPTSIEFVSELPKTPSGKIQKHVLREQYWQGHARRVGGV